MSNGRFKHDEGPCGQVHYEHCGGTATLAPPPPEGQEAAVEMWKQRNECKVTPRQGVVIYSVPARREDIELKDGTWTVKDDCGRVCISGPQYMSVVLTAEELGLDLSSAFGLASVTDQNEGLLVGTTWPNLSDPAVC